MANSNNTGALLAGLAWLPWSEDPSGNCPAAIVRFFESLGIDASTALDRFSQNEELSEWLKNHFGPAHREKVRWFELGIRTMIASSMFANGAPPEVAEDEMTAYLAVLQEVGVSLEARDRIATLVRTLALAPLDQEVFARLLETLQEQSRIRSTVALLKPHSNPLGAASYYLTVALVIALALAGFSKNAPPFVLPLFLVAGLLLTTAMGGFGAFRD